MLYIKETRKLLSFPSYVKNFCKPQILLSVICLLSLSCTFYPKRPNRFKHKFQQGTADDLFNLSDLLGENPVIESEEEIFPLPTSIGIPKTDDKIPLLSSQGGYPGNILNKQDVSGLLKIRTVERGEKATVSFAQENIRIDPNISFINEYEFLDYKVLNPEETKWHKYLTRLLGKLGKIRKFKGFPNTDYYILPRLFGNYLILYKLGPQDKIPYDELPLAKRINGMLAVPLVGYPVKYCIAEAIPDINERKTGQYKPKCEGMKLEYAEYVKLDEGKKQVFQYEDKPDLFPRNFFNPRENKVQKDRWFYVRTVVKSPDRTVVGHQLFTPASLVEFHTAPGKLDVLDASGDINTEDKIRTLFIPVEWVDYQIKRDSENLHPHFSEEPKIDLYDSNLRYFKIKYDELVKNEIEYGGEKTLKGVFITDDYFSFDVEITSKGIGAYLVKFAFFKESTDKSVNYIPKQWFEKDSTLFFPSFSEKRKSYRDAMDHSEEDYDRFFRTTRFNPKAEEIRWYFSKQTSKKQWVRALGHLAVDLINLALEEAGRDSDHKLKVILDTSADKEVGDIRYNILNLIVSEGKPNKGLLGLGPNVANPITGEVVSATANVWVTHILSYYVTAVRRYIRFHTYPPEWKMEPFSRDVTTLIQNRVNEKAPKCGDLSLKPLSVTTFLHEKIQSVCTEVTDFIDQQKKNKVTYDPENPDLQDKEITKSCARKLAALPVLWTILHEMLHGFAQRHVFSASVDSENFYKSYDEIEKVFGNRVSDEMEKLFGSSALTEATNCHPHPAQYSSVMDYIDLFNPILFVPGKLDIAALRFIYFDKVDLKQGGVLEVPSGADEDPNNPQKSILRAAASKGYLKEDLKNYKILCGGDKVQGSQYKETDLNQPLCEQFDYGVNPFEIVINDILRTNNFLTSRMNRYDSTNISSSSQETYLFRDYSGKLYKKWKQYRDELLNQQGKSIEDFSFINQNHITQYQQALEEEQSQSPDFKSYYDIRQPIFDYFKRLIFIPVKHCVYKKELYRGGVFHYSAVALENIMTEVRGDYFTYHDNSRERFINCKSSVVENWAHQNEKGILAGEVGFLGQTTKYFLRAKKNDPTDEISVFKFWNVIAKEETKNPLFDIVMEPDFGAEYYEKVRAYMLEGINLNPYISGKMAQDPNIPRDSAGHIHLNRVLSYKTDEETAYNNFSKKNGILVEDGIFRKRWLILEAAINRLKNHGMNGELALQFDLKPRKLIDIGRTAKSIKTNSDYPFFTQVHDSWQEEKSQRNLSTLFDLDNSNPFNNDSQDISFASFIKNHPATLYNGAGGPFIVIPYTDTPENLPSQLFRRFNKFADCIKNHEALGIACDDIEEKKIFIKTILDSYYHEEEEDQEKEEGEECHPNHPLC